MCRDLRECVVIISADSKQSFEFLVANRPEPCEQRRDAKWKKTSIHGDNTFEGVSELVEWKLVPRVLPVSLETRVCNLWLVRLLLLDRLSLRLL